MPQEAKKTRFGKKEIFIGIAVAALLLLGVFLGIGLAGRGAYQAADYENAITYLKWSPFFRTYYWDCYHKLGAQALETGEFEQAIEYLRLVEDDAKAELSFISGVQTLAQYSTDVDVKQTIQSALTYFEECKELPGAQACLGALTELQAQNYTDAAVSMLAEDVIAVEQWQGILSAACAGDTPGTIEAFLDQAKASALLNEECSGVEGPDMTQIMETVDKFAALSQEESAFFIDSLDAVKEAGGNGTEGQVLFVVERRLYGAALPQYEICTELMSQLPAAWIPEDISLAEYVVVLSYDYQQIGMLDNQVTAKIREFGCVTAYDIAAWEVVYESGSIRGEEPAAMCYSNTPPKYLTGGSPELALMVRRALLAIME